jgi:hypothetical protein
MKSMLDHEPMPALAAAEKAYVAAELERLQLVCDRNRMDRSDYLRDLSAAWLRSVDALEILTALRNAEASARLMAAAERRALA